MSVDHAYWDRRLELLSYIGCLPWERYFFNRLRKQEGLPPLRYRDALRELREG